jgi:hypothetical protein
MQPSSISRLIKKINPIPVNHTTATQLPLPVRELADLLAEIAVKQLKTTHQLPQKARESNCDHH